MLATYIGTTSPVWPFSHGNPVILSNSKSYRIEYTVHETEVHCIIDKRYLLIYDDVEALKRDWAPCNRVHKMVGSQKLCKIKQTSQKM